MEALMAQTIWQTWVSLNIVKLLIWDFVLEMSIINHNRVGLLGGNWTRCIWERRVKKWFVMSCCPSVSSTMQCEWPVSVWWWEWWWCSRGSADWRLAGGHCTRHQHYAAAVLQSPLQLHAAHTTTSHQARVAGRGQKTFVSNNKWTNFSLPLRMWPRNFI